MHSQTAEYALRAMACLAQYRELVATPALAEQTGIPSNYLAKVLQLLAGASLITGRRGVGGGYRLARGPEDVTLLQIIDAVDPMVRIQRCPVHPNGHAPGSNGTVTLCALHRRMDAAVAAAIEVYRTASLRDLLNDESPVRPVCRTGAEKASAPAASPSIATRPMAARAAAATLQHASGGHAVNGNRHSNGQAAGSSNGFGMATGSNGTPRR